MSDILKAFLDQSNIDPDDITQSQAFEELENEMEARGDKEAYKMAQQMKMDMARDSIANHVSVPSRLDTKSLEGKTEVHPNLAGYDHALEKDRWKGNRGFIPKTDEDPDYPVDDDGVIHIDL